MNEIHDQLITKKGDKNDSKGIFLSTKLLPEIGCSIPAKFHDFSVMLTNLKDSHDLTIVF